MPGVLLLFLLLCADPGEITAAADLAGWVDRHAARAILPPIRSGRLADLFDGNPDTWIRCGEAGRAEFTFLLPRALPVIQVGIRFAGPGVYRWYVSYGPPAPHGGASRFLPLFPPRYVEGGVSLDAVRLPAGIRADRIRLTVERLTLGSDLFLSELFFYTRIPVAALRLRSPPARVLLDDTTNLHPEAVDSFGGILPLDRGIRWEVHPRELARVRPPTRLAPRAAGRFRLRFRFLGRSSPWYTVEAVPPAPPPCAPSVQPFRTTAYVSFPSPPSPWTTYALYLRADGAPPPATPLRRFPGTSCTVWGLEPGKAYHCALAGLDARGRPATRRSPEVRFRTLPAETPGLKTLARLQVLVPIYAEAYTPAEADAIERGFDLARTFFFRGTGARLDVHLHIRRLRGTPPSGGPGMTAVAEDLERRDVFLADYDAIHAVTGEVGRNMSGHRFPGGVVGSMGADANAAYPGTDPAVDYRACWTLVHELQHTLMIFSQRAPSGPSMGNGHFLDEPPPTGDAPPVTGPFYAGERVLLARFKGYHTLPTPLRARVETRDGDGDGLPDADPRLPADEARFGSDPGLWDTDGDGLNDLEEFCAGIYEGTDPRRADTDGDGLPDGIDPFPLNDFTGVIPRATLRPGEPPPSPLSTGVYYSPWSPAPDFRVHAAWDPGHLYLAFYADRPISVTIHLDGSGRLGPFASDRRIFPEKGKGPVGSDVYTGDAALHVAFGEPHLRRGKSPVPGARVCSLERKEGVLLWVALPKALGPGTSRCRMVDDALPGRGLTLVAGRILGLAFTLLPADPPTGAEAKGPSLPGHAYEPHRFLPAVLVEGR